MPQFHNVQAGKTVVNRAIARGLADLGDDTVGAAGPLVGALKRFFTEPETVTPGTVYADFTFAVLAGADTVPATFTPALNNGAKKVAKKTQIEAVAGSGQTEESIRGAVIVNAADDDWLIAKQFNDAVDVAVEGDAVSTDITLNIEVEGTDS